MDLILSEREQKQLEKEALEQQKDTPSPEIEVGCAN
jgi:hypothetical protein